MTDEKLLEPVFTPENAVEPVAGEGSSDVPHKKGSPIVLIVSGFLLLLSLTTAGYFFTQNRRLSSQIEQMAPSPAPEVSVEPSADPVADWKTYTNTAHGYSFRYPAQGWTMVSKDEAEKYNSSVQLVHDSSDTVFQVLANMDGIGGVGRSFQGTEVTVAGLKLYRYEVDSKESNTRRLAVTDSLTNSMGFFEYDGKTFSVTMSHALTGMTSAEIENLRSLYTQILSTFSFAQPDDVVSTNAKVLAYRLPPEWKTAASTGSSFEIGYDPAKYTAVPTERGITFNYLSSPGSFSFQNTPYDGGSRHMFIYKQQGYREAPVDERMEGYHEQEYTVNGWKCLVLYRLSFSAAGTTWGMCPITSSQAIYFGGPESQAETEAILASLKNLSIK